MDGESEPNPVVAEDVGERVEPMDATPSPQQNPTPPSEESSEAVSMVTEDGATKEGGTEDNDDDVVLVGEEAPQPSATTLSQDTPSTDCPELAAAVATVDTSTAAKTPGSPASSNASTAAAPPKPPTTTTEPIVIDDEEDSEQRDTSSSTPVPPEGTSASHSPGALSSTEPDSEIRIASVTTLGSASQKGGSTVNSPPHPEDAQPDMNLMITSVTSLQGGAAGQVEENGLQIHNTFSLNPDTPSGRPTASFNPGRGSGPMGQLVQNGDMGTHNRADSWISQSASVPRNQKQTGVDSPSPATSLPKPPGQSSSTTSSSGSQPQPRTVKVTCANCKKPLKKGQTAYQRKGSTHLFCSTTCLSAFSHKPAPKKSCTMCKKDITNMKGTIVAQVDSSESFQEFCSTGCLGAYENKQNPPKSNLKTKCTVCGKHTEVSLSNFLSTGKLESCLSCKTLIKTGEVLHSVGAGGTMVSYCSVNCMNKGKLTTTSTISTEPTCHFCKRNSLPQYQATLPEGNVLNFCSSQCVTKFQNATLQTATNGQAPLSTTNSTVKLKCNYCRGVFSLKPEILEWEDKVYQFCSKTCCEDYKKLHCIVTFCEYCQEEKTLHEMVKFSGVKRPFCSEGCKLLFKQDFIKRLGLKCVSCNHCNQLCKRGVTRPLGGMTRDFCSEACAKKFNDWYYKAARCDCCKVQGNLTESVMWRSEVKQFCDQECLLRFYCQQNEPIMVTQKGPENTTLGKNCVCSTAAYTGGGLVRDVKNKAVLCKPLTLTKATYCKPHMQSKLLQTDDGVKREYVPVPIPVPVFIPMPMNMYSQVTPTPLSLPVPVPVPVFLPTTLQGAEEIVQTINELKTKVPSDPLEDDLITMAEVITEDRKPEVPNTYEPDLDLEADFPQGKRLLIMDLFALKGNKKLAVEEKPDVASSSSSNVTNRTSEGRSLPLKARYGINAWKRWALSPPDQSDDTKAQESSKAARPKRNLLSVSSEELNVALSRFVREVCRPSGERYSPDSILYLCLGIQQHLHSKGRKDDLFSDPCYQQFGEELNKVLKDWQPSVLPDGSLWGRVEEQSLWSSRHLGEQSPAALLRSLVYLNTKYFGLRTVEQHLRLSFSNVYGPDTLHPVTKETTICIRVPSVSQDHHGEAGKCIMKRKRRVEEDDEQEERDSNSGGSAQRCPAKKHECHLYELYRSNLDVFYVQPDPDCSPDDPLWFSSTPLDRRILESLLIRILLVRDIYSDKQLLEENTEENTEEEGGGETVGGE
uniref:Zinc finger MYM-type containing 2 n=1 Tax=Pundamilia nyererei TaxID=303518 RepID=A0A3B4FGF9_9CICH